MSGIREVNVIKQHLLPIVDGLSVQQYRDDDKYYHQILDVLCGLGYTFLGSGCCCAVYRKGDGKYLMKVFMPHGTNIPLYCNPTRKIWREMVRKGLAGSYNVVKHEMANEAFKLGGINGFIPVGVEHFLFYDYIHPKGLLAVQRAVDCSSGARGNAFGLLKSCHTHVGNVGMDGERPVIVDWF